MKEDITNIRIKRSKPFTDDSEISAVSEVVKSGMHTSGEQTKLFEEKMSELIGVKYAKATTSGTTALHLALMAFDIGRGDEVIIPSYICQAVMNAVNYTGAKPVLADIDPDFGNKGHNISAKTIRQLITEKTKAIIVVHMFGVPTDISLIQEIAGGIPIIEDCAQGLGSMHKYEVVGSLGDISIFSFFGTKTISTGHGGMVLTNSEKLHEKIKDMTMYDQRDKYKIAYNYCLSDIQSSLGTSQLKKLTYFIKRRKEISEKYDKAFKNLPFQLPPKIHGSVPFKYIIRLKDKEAREKLENTLKEKNIGVDRPVFKPLHQYLGLNKDKFPNSEEADNISLSLPVYPALTEEEVERIIGLIKIHYN